ncbi:MAG: ArnT family glycosyltransferase [Pyrinomonadaceae bacterium]
MAAMVFAVFAVACIVVFLANRGSDVGQLPKLVGNLGGGPFFGDDVLTHLFAGFETLIIGGSWLVTGLLVIFIIKKHVDLQMVGRIELVASYAVGAAVWSFIWFFLGIAGAYSAAAAIVAILLFHALLFLATRLEKRVEDDEVEDQIISIFKTKETKQLDNDLPKTSITDKVLIGLIGFQILISLIASLAPPIAKDTLLYHFAVPKAFAAQGSSAFIDGNIASYLSLGTEMHIVWARLFASESGADAASGVVVWIFFPLLLMTAYSWAREIKVSRTWSLVATAMVAAVPTAYHVASSGYIDLSLALYITLAIYSMTRWWKEQTWSWVILIVIFLGAALSVKLTSVFVFAAFALIVLLRARETKNPVAIAPGSDSAASVTPGKIVVSGFAALLLAGVIASPWYLRTWVATGSPVFPFYMSIWPGKANGWDVERSNLFQAMNAQYGGVDTNKLNYITAPVRLSVAAQPEQPVNYDGVLGVAFLIGLPLLVWALWKFELPVEVKICAGVAGIMYLFWLFSSEQLRYLLPIVPVLAIAIAASAEKIGEKIGGIRTAAQYAFIAAAFCGLLTTLAWFCMKAPLRVVLGGETRDEYLTRNLDYYPYYQTLNTDTPTDAKVWLINMRRDTYHIERPVFSDYLFEDWTLRKMVWESHSVEELRTKTAALGIKYVLTRHDFLFDYDRSTLVDDKKPRVENEAKLKIGREFILDSAHTIKANEKFSLIKVF